MKVLVTGSQGFIGGYIVKKLLKDGHFVYGIDNFSKYGSLVRPHDNHPNFKLYKIDLSRPFSCPPEICFIDHFIAGAAMIGGIAYFHKFAYDILATNERILANSFDLAIQLYKQFKLKKITVLSSSMVFERSNVYPTPESEVLNSPPPSSTYGFQKLSTEYFCFGAYLQHKLPYTIIRPFNCVGIGEDASLSDEKRTDGNVEIMMSHVVPDLIKKILKGQNPVCLLGDGKQIRCFTNGADIARAVVLSLEHPKALCEDFNISSDEAISIEELAQKIWEKINSTKPFKTKNLPAYLFDVQKRIPDTTKAFELLNFKANISLEESLDEVINYIKNNEL